MSRGEVIQVISDLGQAKSFKAAENHLNYLIRSGRLPKLKRKGRFVTAQTTTSERCQITSEQQVRWHFLIESEWDYLQLTNHPSQVFTELHEHFQLNLDEACFLCSDGILKIIGDGAKKHHDKNMSDSCVSITIVRIGSAAGTNGPVLFLASGTKRKRKESEKSSIHAKTPERLVRIT